MNDNLILKPHGPLGEGLFKNVDEAEFDRLWSQDGMASAREAVINDNAEEFKKCVSSLNDISRVIVWAMLAQNAELNKVGHFFPRDVALLVVESVKRLEKTPYVKS